MEFLSKAEIEEKNRKFRQLEGSVGDFYAKHGDAMVQALQKSGYEGIECGGETEESIKRNQAEFSRFDPEVLYGQPPLKSKQRFRKFGSDWTDNIANF